MVSFLSRSQTMQCQKTWFCYFAGKSMKRTLASFRCFNIILFLPRVAQRAGRSLCRSATSHQGSIHNYELVTIDPFDEACFNQDSFHSQIKPRPGIDPVLLANLPASMPSPCSIETKRLAIGVLFCESKERFFPCLNPPPARMRGRF